MLNNLPLHAVGLDERMEVLMDELEMESESVIIVAICGMGGIGKTTLAKVIFNSISSRFQARSFVAADKAKEVCKLQQDILKDLIRQDILVKSVEHGKALMKAHLGSARALVIVDNIDNPRQLESLGADWLPPGSRLIITSQDSGLLAFPHIDKIYHMNLLDFEHSIELFSWHAFLRKHPSDLYEERSQKIVEACNGIPLLLEVAGASLYGREDIIHWDESIRHLESTVNQDIHRRLCVSLLFLSNHEIKIFLDIACFFVGKENLETTSRYWESIGFSPNTALENLILKLLISVDDTNQFIVHDHVQDMGRAMVSDESPDLGKRSRLWRLGDALQVISNGMEFKNLNVLRVSSAQYLESLPDFSYFPALTVLDLEDCPKLKRLPDSIGILEGLKCLNLSWCKNLIELPHGISKLSSLERLLLSHCSSLKELPCAAEELMTLKELDIGFLRHVEKLPSFVKLLKLEKLILAGCLSIRFLPNAIGELNNLKELDIQNLGLIQELPSLAKLSCLKKLILSGCGSLRNLPTSIRELRCLQYLEMNQCSSIDCLPDEFGDLFYLEELFMNHCPRLTQLPDSFGNLLNLRTLELRHNPNLMQLPSSFAKLASLVWFDARIDGLRSLETLYIGGSSVSILDLRQQIKDMPQLEEVCIYANRIPQCLELKSGNHCLNNDNFKGILHYSIENNIKCKGVFLCFVLNFMHEYHTFASLSQNFMELAITVDDEEAILVTIFSNRQNVEGDQLYICIYGETHSLVRRLETAVNISVKVKGRNIQIREGGMQLLYNGIGSVFFETLVNDLSLLEENYTSKASKDKVDAIEDDSPYKTKEEEEADDDLYDYGYATSEGEYQTDED
ncbi:hypothetical protein KI387_021604 [Taxus chinensis]|uniref:Uncharacterized protein n=1 Tax=Taxus chinensis TaxID=29808 RepID=A0AA38LFA2_TAXCH|nr:hypothetical protein KI387_021604 [Taxus chinensis]